jgi:uncharacterized protein (DUF2267 family)
VSDTHPAGDGHDEFAGDGHDESAGDGHDESAGDGHREASPVSFETFTTVVRRQLVLADESEATRVVRAVVTTLGERVDDDTARALAGPLPAEIQLFLARADSGQAFDYERFCRRVADRADTTPETAEYHAMVVLEQVTDVTPHSTLARLEDVLPAAYDDLFALVDLSEKA